MFIIYYSFKAKLLIFFVLILLTFISCSRAVKHMDQEQFIIDLTKLPDKENLVSMSQFASEITYLTLESNKNCLIAPSARFDLFDSIIVSSAFHQILTFDRNSGKFLKSIGEYGRSPKGYMSSENSYIKNGEIIIAATGWDLSWMEFSTEGEILNKLEFDEHPRAIASLNDSLYAVYYEKDSNSDSLRIQIFDSRKKKVVTTIYDNRLFDYKPRRTTNYGAFFYCANNKLFIKEYFNDTVFQVTKNMLSPAFKFDSGEYSPPFFEKHRFDFVQYHNIGSILEANEKIFFQLVFKAEYYYCYFDKLTNQLFISKYNTSKIKGFENDIDGFMPFQPTSVSSKNELVGFLEAYQIKKWFKENPEQAAKLPSHLQKFKDIDENDNPVLMLVKLK